MFHAVGFISGHAPERALARWENPVAIVGDVLLVMIGHALDLWPIILPGAMAAGCGLGTVVTRWWVCPATQSPHGDPRSSQ